MVCGGFVYFCLFRRPLLSALNACWRFIESFKAEPPVVRLLIPREVVLELTRFCALVPLARLDFRIACMGDVTASDASSSGGGACVSTGLTAYGACGSQRDSARRRTGGARLDAGTFRRPVRWSGLLAHRLRSLGASYGRAY